MARTVSDVAFLDTLITGEAAPTVDLRAARIAVPRPDYWERGDVDPGVADVILQAFAKLREDGCTLVEIDFEGEVKSIVGTLFQPTPASVFAGEGMDAPQPTSLTMARWLREHAPDVTVEQMYGDRPIRDGRRSFPPVEEQVRVLKEAARRYAEIYRSHGVLAVAFPTAPIVATPIRPSGPKEPLGELITIKGKQVEEGRVVAQNLFIAPRVGAPALSIPAGLSQGLPVGLNSMRCLGTTANYSVWGSRRRRPSDEFPRHPFHDAVRILSASGARRAPPSRPIRAPKLSKSLDPRSTKRRL